MRRLALIAVLLAAPASAQVSPALWDQCIAAPDPACALSLALAEVAADPEMTGRDYRLRVMVELLVAHVQAAAASDALRQIADPGDAVRLWPLVLALRPDPADLRLATELAAQIDNPLSQRVALSDIAVALVRAGDLAAAQAVIDSHPEPLSVAIVALAVAMVHAGDPQGAAALAARVEQNWQDDARAALMLARAEMGDLPSVRAEWNALPDSDKFDSGVGLVPLLASPAHVDRLLALLRNPFGGQADYFDRQASALGRALATAPAEYLARQVLRLAEAEAAPEHRAAILIEVLRATDEATIAPLVLSIADEVADPVTQALVRIDAAPFVDAAQLATLAAWASDLALADRAYVMGELAIASGDAGIAAQAALMLPAYGDEIDRDQAFARMVAAVAAGPEPARVADLFAAVTLDRPTRDDVVLAAVGPLAANGQADLALTLARAMTYAEREAMALGRIGAVTGDAGVLAEALGLVRAEDMNFYRTAALTEIAAAMLGHPG